MKKAFILCLVLLVFSTLSAQKKDKPIYKYIKNSLGGLNFTDGFGNSNNLKSHYGISYGITAYFRKNIFLNSTWHKSSATLTQDLLLKEDLFPKDSTFHFNGWNINIGYVFNLNRNFSFEPYLGISENMYRVEEYNTGEVLEYFNTGFIPLGVSLNWYFGFSEKTNNHFSLFLNNYICFTNMKELHPDFDNWSYVFEFGIAYRIDEVTRFERRKEHERFMKNLRKRSKSKRKHRY